jgi:hypothetical protein
MKKESTTSVPDAAAPAESPTAALRPWVPPTAQRLDLRDAMAKVVGAGDGGASS